jgi:ABC-type nitrate/sulfonate/bicarbonate transport system substrate-binding protein
LGGVPEHFNLPWHLAMESTDPKSGLADLGASWEDQPGGTGEMLGKLAEARLDIVSILTEGTVKAVADGLDVTVMQVYVESPLQWGVFIPGGSEPKELADLDDARIAVSRFGSGSHLMAYILADRLGWSVSDDQFVVVKNLEGAITAFHNGHADLFLWDQFMTRSLVADGRFRQIGVQPTPWPPFVIAARNEIVTGRTSELGRILDAVVTHAAELTLRPDGPEVVAERYGITVETAKEWFGTTSFAARRAVDPRIATEVLDALSGAGLR